MFPLPIKREPEGRWEITFHQTLLWNRICRTFLIIEDSSFVALITRRKPLERYFSVIEADKSLLPTVCMYVCVTRLHSPRCSDLWLPATRIFPNLIEVIELFRGHWKGQTRPFLAQTSWLLRRDTMCWRIRHARVLTAHHSEVLTKKRQTTVDAVQSQPSLGVNTYGDDAAIYTHKKQESLCAVMCRIVCNVQDLPK